MGYVPDGVSPEQWKKMQEKEKQKKVSIVFGFHHCSIHASVDW
jgi:urocanate hydratase